MKDFPYGNKHNFAEERTKEMERSNNYNKDGDLFL
jgi:hypothetical protein